MSSIIYLPQVWKLLKHQHNIEKNKKEVLQKKKDNIKKQNKENKNIKVTDAICYL